MAAVACQTLLVKPMGQGPVLDAIDCAQASIARALRDYGVTEKPTFHPSCSFSADNLRLAMEEMQKHLGVDRVLERKCAGTGSSDLAPPLKAAWVYCNTPQEVTILSYLIRELQVEHLYLGVTVHLSTSASDAECLDVSVGNDVAATCAAMELLLRELRHQSSLRYLRLDFNVLASSYSPFQQPACRFLGTEAVCHSIELLTAALRKLLDTNTGIKTFKLGLHQRLYELFDRREMFSVCRRLDQRIALLLGKHDRVGARSPVLDVPSELLSSILNIALPLDQSVEVLPLRK